MSNSTEQSFRDSLRNFNQSRASNRPTGSPIIRLFTDGSSSSSSAAAQDDTSAFSSLLGSVRTGAQNALSSVGLVNSAEQEESFFGLTWTQRCIGFAICMAAAGFSFLLAFVTLGLIAISPGKFATSFTLGSLFSLFGVALLKGPYSHFKHMISSERLPFTVAYVGTMIATLYFAVGVRSYFLTLIFSILQLVALLWYFASYIPGGTSGLRFMGRAAGGAIGLPV
ncbi:ER-to-golgi vesicle protein transport Sft2 [Polychytrium aggregatum]|uniref:ER-to-golgi vesicle protein transport Sft2 n=1 Tax=Polychytrium aggregatum TaxID=110093 RepID=UPI0022FDC817|nr:ER-to-golgi vesicle protein transport Sft2 [Polychytrium aggregatum]KAI9206035.1 ER-to-golgi vesicle protein transport Sft2 [Polychytrium aggregatum]